MEEIPLKDPQRTFSAENGSFRRRVDCKSEEYPCFSENRRLRFRVAVDVNPYEYARNMI